MLYKGYATVAGSVALGMIRMPLSTRISPWGKTQVDVGSGGLMSESYQTGIYYVFTPGLSFHMDGWVRFMVTLNYGYQEPAMAHSICLFSYTSI